MRCLNGAVVFLSTAATLTMTVSYVSSFHLDRLSFSSVSSWKRNHFTFPPRSDDISTKGHTKKRANAGNPLLATTACTIDFVSSDEEEFLKKVGSFLVDAFWLSSEHHQLEGDMMNGAVSISQALRASLATEQSMDLQSRYGARMGKRLLNSCVLGAIDPNTNDLLGVTTVKVTLLNQNQQEVMETETAESTLKQAVASLGPQQRRQYKDASVHTIVKDLLSPSSDETSIKPICVMSNLAVSTKARRQGIAQRLCQQVESLVKNQWGYDEIYLLVETANVAARSLYESKLGFRLAFTQENATALRADLRSGSFIEIQTDTLILTKQL